MEKGMLLNNRYALEKPLASGGMAHVWRGRDELLGRPVAVKILRDEFTRKPDFQEKFRREAQAIARLSHPNLVTVYDFGIQDGQCFMIMEYVEGEDLKSFLRRARPQPLEAWLDITIQVCEGLGLAHRAGLVHCDVKPQNILLAADLLAKVADFGIARATAAPRLFLTDQTQPLEDDTVWGSPQYVSPEQGRGEALTPSSDIYSIGVVLFEMLTGRLPFPGRDPRTLLLQHEREPAPSPRLLNPDVPPELEAVVLRALAKDPARRYRNGDQMARVLKTLLAGGTAPLPEAGALPEEADADEEPAIDWTAVGLGFLALITVGGLIPLWVYVYFLYNPPGG
jgi:serine/threonine protein kinase